MKRVVLEPGKAQVSVYPNPSTNKSFNVKITGAAVLPRMEVIQSDGKLLLQVPLKSFADTFSFPRLAPGVYLLRFHSNEFVTHKRIIVL